MTVEQQPFWQRLLEDAADRLMKPVLALGQQDSQLYWVFVLSALLVTVAVFWITHKPSTSQFLSELRGTYFSKAVWAHVSAIADYKYYFVNGILYPLIFTPIILSGAWLAVSLAGGLTVLFGARDFVHADAAIVNAAYTVVFFFARDLGLYLGHWVQHRFDFLWQFHKVHHSAEVVTPITNFRVHPVDLLSLATGSALCTGPVTGVFMWLFADQFGFFMYFGLHVALVVFFLVGNLRHSHVWLSYGPRLNCIFVSPAQHQIHHSAASRHFGKNIGADLAIWDWMFGTLYVPKEREQFALGLGDGTERQFHNVLEMYVRPVRLLRRAGKLRSPFARATYPGEKVPDIDCARPSRLPGN